MPKFMVLISLMTVLAACGSAAGPSARLETPEGAPPTGAAHPGAGMQVVAAVYPLAWLAEQVAPGADVTLLNAGGAEAHDLEITPAQRAAIETADVVLFMGDIDYQPQVEQALASAEGEVVDVTEVAGERRLLDASGDRHGHDGEEAADGGDDHADEGDGDDHADAGGVTDPHVWFDMSVMADAATRTGEAFSARDPATASVYVANAKDVVEQLNDLGSELDGLFGGDCEFDEVIVSHVAYAYLTEPRGKELHGITGIDPEAGASGGALAELVADIREEGFRYVVAEPVEGRADAEALAREAGVELLDIYPLDVVAADQAATGFPDLVREQARTLATAYGCA